MSQYAVIERHPRGPRLASTYKEIYHHAKTSNRSLIEAADQLGHKWDDMPRSLRKAILKGEPPSHLLEWGHAKLPELPEQISFKGKVEGADLYLLLRYVTSTPGFEVRYKFDSPTDGKKEGFSIAHRGAISVDGGTYLDIYKDRGEQLRIPVGHLEYIHLNTRK